MASNFVKRLAGIAVAALIAVPLAAQDFSQMSPEEIRKALTLGSVTVGTLTQPFFRGAPGTSSGSPSGFGAAWRDGFIGGGYQQVRGGGQSDGSIAGGFGLGNAQDAIGLEVVVASLSTFRSGLFDRTAFSFKAHRMVSSTAAIAVGVENAIIAGGGKTDGASSVFVAGSKVIRPSSGFIQQISLSGGIGNGRFRFEKDVRKDNKTVNLFASAGFQVHEKLSVLADWGGQDLTLGVSMVPFKAFPVIITPAVADLTGQNGNDPRFTLGFGIGMKF